MKSDAFSPESRHMPHERFSSVKRTVAGTIAGLAFLFAPVAQRALAQPAAKEQPSPGFRVSKPQVEVENMPSNMYASVGSEPAIVTIRGPIDISINAFPIMKSWQFGSKESLEVDISYMLDGTMYSLKGKVSKLDAKVHGFEIKKGHSLCSLVEIRLAIPEGEHQFSLVDPDAIIGVEENLALVSLVTNKPIYPEPIGVVTGSEPKKGPEPVTRRTVDKPPQAEKKPDSAKALPQPEPKPEEKMEPGPLLPPKPAEAPEQPRSRLIRLSGQRYALPGPGGGDVNEIDLLATPLVSDIFAVAVGTNLSSHGRILELGRFRQTMRSFSADLEAGIGLSEGKHNAFLVLFGGVRKTSGMLTLPDGRSDPLELMQAEYGAMAGYDYNGLFGLSIHGSNNPFSPGGVELYASLPYWYLDDNFPMLAADVSWLNHLREKAVEGILGKTRLDVTDIKTRLTLSVPLARLGPIVPTLLGGVDMSTAEGLKVSGHAGGALGAEFLDAVKIEAGAAYGFDGSLLIILNGRLLH